MNWKQFIYRYKHIFVALYFPVYMVWFMWLEARDDVPFTYIHCAIDDYIPFCEYFIIPYLLWFVYVFATLALLFFDLKHLENYYQTIATLIIGMTASLLIYTLFPNAQNMRPTQFTHDNIFTQVISMLYATDTDTNVLPSIHVFNSLAIHAGLCRYATIHKQKIWRNGSFVLCLLICMSTLFLKKHPYCLHKTIWMFFIRLDCILPAANLFLPALNAGQSLHRPVDDMHSAGQVLCH